MKRFPRFISEREKRCISLYSDVFLSGCTWHAVTADKFGMEDYSQMSINDWYILRVINEYDRAIQKFILKGTAKNFYKGVFREKDPRIIKNKWSTFKTLGNRLLEFNISAKTYFYYYMSVRNKKVKEYYYLAGDMNMITFIEWYDKRCKEAGFNIDELPIYSDKAILKRDLKYYNSVMDTDIKQCKLKSERDYWLAQMPDWITDKYIYEFLRRRWEYKKLYLEGEMEGPGFPNPFNGEVKPINGDTAEINALIKKGYKIKNEK